jgi:hypothetical protein
LKIFDVNYTEQKYISGVQANFCHTSTKQIINYCLIPSGNIVRVIKSRRMRWAGHVARIGEGRDDYGILFGRPEDKIPRGRPRCEGNIKMDLRETRIDGANWIRLVQDRVQWRAFVMTVMNLRVP